MADNDRLADDLLRGAEQIAEFTGLTVRQVYHQQKNLRLTHLGATLIGTKNKITKLLTGEAA
jgi:hypothetical protein